MNTIFSHICEVLEGHDPSKQTSVKFGENRSAPQLLCGPHQFFNFRLRPANAMRSPALV